MLICVRSVCKQTNIGREFEEKKDVNCIQTCNMALNTHRELMCGQTVKVVVYLQV